MLKSIAYSIIIFTIIPSLLIGSYLAGSNDNQKEDLYDYDEITNSHGINEIIKCKIESLEEHGFIQLSNNKEYVCTNEEDHTDFVIIEDEQNSLALNDRLNVYLNSYDEVINYYIN